MPRGMSRRVPVQYPGMRPWVCRTLTARVHLELLASERRCL